MTERVLGICRPRGAADASSSRNRLPLSTVEWIASLSIAALPVKPAAANFVAATRRLPMRAA